MSEGPESPRARKFWIVVGALTFGPIALFLGVAILAALLGDGTTSLAPLGPIFTFGMAMVGVILIGSTVADIAKGRRWDVSESILALLWLGFFGWAFLRSIGIEF